MQLIHDVKNPKHVLLSSRLGGSTNDAGGPSPSLPGPSHSQIKSLVSSYTLLHSHATASPQVSSSSSHAPTQPFSSLWQYSAQVFPSIFVTKFLHPFTLHFFSTSVSGFHPQLDEPPVK